MRNSHFLINVLFFFFYRLLFGKFRPNLRRNVSDLSRSASTCHKYQKFHNNYLAKRQDLSNHTLIFNVEGTLLKSTSLFPYFMLVAFEAGSILRAFVLFLLYPFVRLVSQEMGLKIMVMVCFFGIKKNSFTVGRAVLPKFFLEDVGLEMFEVVRKGGKKVGVSNLPQVMVECFLRDYLEIDVVVGRDLKEFCGYFVGFMEEKKKYLPLVDETDDQVPGEEEVSCSLIGFTDFHKAFDHHLSSLCREIHLVSRSEKRSWKTLRRDEYPNPLLFHDGRLAFIPTPLDTLAFFVWFPFALFLAIFRTLVSLSLPFTISIPVAAFSGMLLTVSNPKTNYHNNSHLPNRSKGQLYVCNHRTLLDPLYISFILRKQPTAVTYSLSQISELLSPIKTVRLTRNRVQDANMMETLLNQGDMVVCPEGTTCREPYLLRFSPLFSEMSDEIVPVANDTHVSMFHGTTASGFKCLDPLFFLMNPSPSYTVRFLDKVSGLSTCLHNGERSRYDVANHVQSEIAKALHFECTKLTRRDKYFILAGNEGVVHKP